MPTDRCPYHSRAWGCRCELESGHDGDCVSAGDGFAPGWDPSRGPPFPTGRTNAAREAQAEEDA